LLDIYFCCLYDLATNSEEKLCMVHKVIVMKPLIDGTEFGSITISGDLYKNDVVIRLSGEVIKRKKKLSKAKYGTSHKISLDEAERIYEKGAEKLIIGTGRYNQVNLSKKADEYFREKKCEVQLLPTPKAVEVWNEAKGSVIAMFHVTC